jgi:hypothetical protein
MPGSVRGVRGEAHISTATNLFSIFCIFDEDFGPLFIKFCSYLPYAAKVCLNGHELSLANGWTVCPIPSHRNTGPPAIVTNFRLLKGLNVGEGKRGCFVFV